MSSEIVTRLAQAFRAEGIQYAFGITGSGLSLRFIEALESFDIKYVPVSHEASAAIMAGACCVDGLTRAASISIKGPGFANMVPGMLLNYYEGRPAISVSEAYAGDIPRWRQHKRLDHFSVAESLTKLTTSADTTHIQKVFNLARAEFPGPVHIDLCNEQGGVPEILLEQDLSESVGSEWPLCLEDIKQSQQPVVILGSMAVRMLKDVDWDGLRIPVLTTAAAKGCIDENNPFSGGIVTGEVSPLSPETTILKKSDLIIGIGLRNNEVINPASFSVLTIVLDTVGGASHDGFNVARKLVVSDISEKIKSLFPILLEKQWGGDEILLAKEKLASHFSAEWLPAQLFRQLQSVMPVDTKMVVDTGFFCTIGETVWAAQAPDKFCGSSVGRFMGTAIPTAIGIAISGPSSPVLCVFGDGGLLPYFAEIEIAVQRKLSIIFIYISDGRYGSVAAYAENSGVVKQAADVGTKPGVKLANALGCPAEKVHGEQDLFGCLSRWNHGCGPLFLQCEFPKEPYAHQARLLR